MSDEKKWPPILYVSDELEAAIRANIGQYRANDTVYSVGTENGVGIHDESGRAVAFIRPITPPNVKP